MSLRQRTGPCPRKKLKQDEEKFLCGSAILFVVLSGRSKDSPRSPLTVPVGLVACVKADSPVCRGTLPPETGPKTSL